jgi:hypothetical protein
MTQWCQEIVANSLPERDFLKPFSQVYQLENDCEKNADACQRLTEAQSEYSKALPAAFVRSCHR